MQPGCARIGVAEGQSERPGPAVRLIDRPDVLGRERYGCAGCHGPLALRRVGAPSHLDSKARPPRSLNMAKRKHSAPADLGSETQPNAIPVEPFLLPDLAPPWRRDEVFHNLAVLITAFEEVERYDPHR